jgi:hypothetical protein
LTHQVLTPPSEGSLTNPEDLRASGRPVPRRKIVAAPPLPSPRWRVTGAALLGPARYDASGPAWSCRGGCTSLRSMRFGLVFVTR